MPAGSRGWPHCSRVVAASINDHHGSVKVPATISSARMISHGCSPSGSWFEIVGSRGVRSILPGPDANPISLRTSGVDPRSPAQFANQPEYRTPRGLSAPNIFSTKARDSIAAMTTAHKQPRHHDLPGPFASQAYRQVRLSRCNHRPAVDENLRADLLGNRRAVQLGRATSWRLDADCKRSHAVCSVDMPIPPTIGCAALRQYSSATSADLFRRQVRTDAVIQQRSHKGKSPVMSSSVTIKGTFWSSWT